MMLPHAQEKQRYVERMFDEIAPRYDFMNRLMTFGIDRSWRRAAIDALEIEPGSVVVDVGCGSGDLCVDLAARGATPVGVDPAAGMLTLARRRAPEAALLRAVGEALPLASAGCDGVVSGFALRNWSSVAAVLVECGRILRHGGRLALLEIDVPEWAPIRTGFRLYFGRIVPFLGSVLSSPAAYRYLAESLAYLPPDVELHRMLVEAGFDDIAKTSLTGGVAQLITATRNRNA